jgi:molybdate transport system ATP-binding protein
MTTGEPASGSILTFDRAAFDADDGPAFSNLSWVLRRGEQWVILGPNNSGKSLLARAAAGEVVPVRGEVELPDPGSDSPGSFQAAALVSPRTHRAVLQAESSFHQSRWHSGLGEGGLNVSRFLSQEEVEEINPFEVNPRRSPRRAFLRRRSASIRLLGVERLLRRKLLQLSNGEMRRVLLARALTRAPRLLVLDDPFAGLDAETRRRLHAVLGRLARRGQPVLVTTSRPDEIPRSATHLLLVDKRRVVAMGPRRRLSRHPLIERLRSEAPEPLRPARVPRPARPEAPRSAPPVRMSDVTIRYGARPILSRVSWTLRNGERWALLGPNGSGKTTLLSLIQGDNPQAYSNDIRLFGIAPDSTSALWRARRLIGRLSPELHLHYPLGWTCLDVVCSGFDDAMGLHQPVSPPRRRQARSWLRRLGFAGREAAPLEELSLAEQRLVLLARAFVKRPRLLILDEPCQSLDRGHRRRVLETIDELVRETGASLVFVTHHRRELPACITHVLRLRAGCVVQAVARRV